MSVHAGAQQEVDALPRATPESDPSREKRMRKDASTRAEPGPRDLSRLATTDLENLVDMKTDQYHAEQEAKYRDLLGYMYTEEGLALLSKYESVMGSDRGGRVDLMMNNVRELLDGIKETNKGAKLSAALMPKVEQIGAALKERESLRVEFDSLLPKDTRRVDIARRLLSLSMRYHRDLDMPLKDIRRILQKATEERFLPAPLLGAGMVRRRIEANLKIGMSPEEAQIAVERESRVTAARAMAKGILHPCGSECGMVLPIPTDELNEMEREYVVADYAACVSTRALATRTLNFHDAVEEGFGVKNVRLPRKRRGIRKPKRRMRSRAVFSGENGGDDDDDDEFFDLDDEDAFFDPEDLFEEMMREAQEEGDDDAQFFDAEEPELMVVRDAAEWQTVREAMRTITALKNDPKRKTVIETNPFSHALFANEVDLVQLERMILDVPDSQEANDRELKDMNQRGYEDALRMTILDITRMAPSVGDKRKWYRDQIRMAQLAFANMYTTWNDPDFIARNVPASDLEKIRPQVRDYLHVTADARSLIMARTARRAFGLVPMNAAENETDTPETFSGSRMHSGENGPDSEPEPQDKATGVTRAAAFVMAFVMSVGVGYLGSAFGGSVYAYLPHMGHFAANVARSTYDQRTASKNLQDNFKVMNEHWEELAEKAGKINSLLEDERDQRIRDIGKMKEETVRQLEMLAKTTHGGSELGKTAIESLELVFDRLQTIQMNKALMSAMYTHKENLAKSNNGKYIGTLDVSPPPVDRVSANSTVHGFAQVHAAGVEDVVSFAEIGNIHTLIDDIDAISRDVAARMIEEGAIRSPADFESRDASAKIQLIQTYANPDQLAALQAVNQSDLFNDVHLYRRYTDTQEGKILAYVDVVTPIVKVVAEFVSNMTIAGALDQVDVDTLVDLTSQLQDGIVVQGKGIGNMTSLVEINKSGLTDASSKLKKAIDAAGASISFLDQQQKDMADKNIVDLQTATQNAQKQYNDTLKRVISDLRQQQKAMLITNTRMQRNNLARIFLQMDQQESSLFGNSGSVSAHALLGETSESFQLMVQDTSTPASALGQIDAQTATILDNLSKDGAGLGEKVLNHVDAGMSLGITKAFDTKEREAIFDLFDTFAKKDWGSSDIDQERGKEERFVDSGPFKKILTVGKFNKSQQTMFKKIGDSLQLALDSGYMSVNKSTRDIYIDFGNSTNLFKAPTGKRYSAKDIARVISACSVITEVSEGLMIAESDTMEPIPVLQWREHGIADHALSAANAAQEVAVSAGFLGSLADSLYYFAQSDAVKKVWAKVATQKTATSSTSPATDDAEPPAKPTKRHRRSGSVSAGYAPAPPASPVPRANAAAEKASDKNVDEVQQNLGRQVQDNSAKKKGVLQGFWKEMRESLADIQYRPLLRVIRRLVTGVAADRPLNEEWTRYSLLNLLNKAIEKFPSLHWIRKLSPEMRQAFAALVIVGGSLGMFVFGAPTWLPISGHSVLFGIGTALMKPRTAAFLLPTAIGAATIMAPFGLSWAPIAVLATMTLLSVHSPALAIFGVAVTITLSEFVSFIQSMFSTSEPSFELGSAFVENLSQLATFLALAATSVVMVTGLRRLVSMDDDSDVQISFWQILWRYVRVITDSFVDMLDHETILGTITFALTFYCYSTMSNIERIHQGSRSIIAMAMLSTGGFAISHWTRRTDLGTIDEWLRPVYLPEKESPDLLGTEVIVYPDLLGTEVIVYPDTVIKRVQETELFKRIRWGKPVTPDLVNQQEVLQVLENAYTAYLNNEKADTRNNAGRLVWAKVDTQSNKSKYLDSAARGLILRLEDFKTKEIQVTSKRRPLGAFMQLVLTLISGTLAQAVYGWSRPFGEMSYFQTLKAIQDDISASGHNVNTSVNAVYNISSGLDAAVGNGTNETGVPKAEIFAPHDEFESAFTKLIPSIIGSADT